jgi:hypothetical protein
MTDIQTGCMVAHQFPAVSVRDGDDMEEVVHTRDGTRG